MADFDDDLPDSEIPEEEPAPRGRLGRLGRRRRRREPEVEGSTGEVPRDDEPAMPEDFGFGEYEYEAEAEAAPPPERERPKSRGRGQGSGGRSRSRSRGGGGRGRGRGGQRATGGAAVLQQPATRLAIGLVFAISLILIIFFVVKDCQRNQLVDSYESYLGDVAALTEESTQQGEQLRVIIQNQDGQTAPQLQQQVRALADQAQGLVDRAEGLDPPGKLNGANGSLVTTLRYRVTGLQSLADAIPQAVDSNDQNFAASTIADPMQRLLASDVIYDDSFLGPAQRALEDDDITGIEVPDPEPFLANAALASTAGAKTLLPALRGNASGANGDGAQDGTLRGTELVKTEALPSGQELTVGNATTIQASEQLKWRVTVENGGDVSLEGLVVKATFTYPDTPNEPQVVEGEIATIDPGQQASVELAGPTDLSFGDPAILKVEVEPVTGEGNTDNNVNEYPVTITI